MTKTILIALTFALAAIGQTKFVSPPNLGTPTSGNATNLTNLPITLTTTGSSGAATYSQSTNTLNIPQYTGGSGGGTGNAGAVVTTTFSATPTFTCPSSSAGTVVSFELSTALTANITGSTLASCTSGSILNFVFTQDATGGRTVVMPTGFSQACPVSSVASSTTNMSFFWDGTTANLISCQGTGPGQGTETAAPSGSPPSGSEYTWFDSTGLFPRWKNSAGTIFQGAKELTSGNIRCAGGANTVDAACTQAQLLSVLSFATGVNTFLGTPSGANFNSMLTSPVPVAAGGTNCASASITCFNNITGYTASGATGTTSTNLVFSTSPTLVTPVLGAATATSLLASGIVDGQAPVTVTTGTTATLGGTYKSGYTFNEEGTAATGVTYTLPTAAAGLQYCVANGYNGTAANTGTLEILTSASGQFIIYTDGTISATGGYVISGGAGGDSACVVGVDSTHWRLYVSEGSWAKH